MKRVIDHSDLIAKLQVLIKSLGDLEPDGEWQWHQLLKRYQKSRYSLSWQQACELELFLTVELERVHNAYRYKQLNLFGGGDDANQAR